MRRASAGVSSIGSRRPEELRQCTQARLQAYVSSHVRQIGASRPCVNLWRSGRTVAASTDIDYLRSGQTGQRPAVYGPLVLGDDGVDRRVCALVLIKGRDELDEQA